jgi:putative membrane protein
MQWWCAAQGIPWEWTWRPYPGVWLFVGLLALTYGLLVRSRGSRPRAASFVAGVVVLWLALDWPVGALGSGYLASLHMVQFVLISLVAPPLLLYGLPPTVLAGLQGRPRLYEVWRRVTNPLVAILLYNATVVATHWPALVDVLMASQSGSFALDMAWLVAGTIYWWPVVCPVPERRFPYVAKIGYLLLNTILNTLPYAFLVFGELPFYATYELAPPVGGLSAREDQRIAGLVMKLGGGAVFWTAIGILFFRWYQAEEGLRGT